MVWEETARQVGMMAAAWQVEESHRERIYNLTMNTVSLVGFGRKAEWGKETIPKGHKYSLVDALSGVVEHLDQIVLLPRSLLRWSPWPAAYCTAKEVDRYIDEMIAEERAKLEHDSNEAHRENIITALLRSNMIAEKNKEAKSAGRVSLTDDEIKGNVFIFLAAGKTPHNAHSHSTPLDEDN